MSIQTTLLPSVDRREAGSESIRLEKRGRDDLRGNLRCTEGARCQGQEQAADDHKGRVVSSPLVFRLCSSSKVDSMGTECRQQDCL